MDKTGSRVNILAIVNKILQSLAEEIMIGSHGCHITASIGVAIYPEHGGNIIELTKKADAAMYEIKATGKIR